MSSFMKSAFPPTGPSDLDMPQAGDVLAMAAPDGYIEVSRWTAATHLHREHPRPSVPGTIRALDDVVAPTAVPGRTLKSASGSLFSQIPRRTRRRLMYRDDIKVTWWVRPSDTRWTLGDPDAVQTALWHAHQHGVTVGGGERRGR